MPRSYDALTAEGALAEQLGTLTGSREQGFNAAEEALHRHPGERPALVWRAGESRRVLSYGELSDRTARMAAILHAHGVGPGAPVAVLLPKRPALLETLFAAWHLGAVVVPLFTAFGPSAIATRVQASGARVLVTEAALTERLPPSADLVVLDVDALPDPSGAPPAIARHPEDSPFILIYTSGTTGPPKGVPVPLFALATFRAYLQYSVDLRPDDVLWNMADPGWAYGLYCGVLGPMLMGQTIRFLEEKFDPARAGAFAREEGVTNLMSSPTAYRALLPGLQGASVRIGSSAGETLSTDIARAFAEATGGRLYDQYGQSELGMVAGNHHGLVHPVHDGTMGLPIPGYHLAVLGKDGTPVRGEPGQLALHLPSSPLNFFSGYFAGAGRDRITADGWYLTGDLVVQHEAGHFAFASRSDDVILTAGYRVGPSEIEEPLLRHPAVADCAVVGKPDRERGEVIVAFIVPADPDIDPGSLHDTLRAYVKREVAAHLAPREIRLIAEVPRTPSGKAQRFVLRDQLDG